MRKFTIAAGLLASVSGIGIAQPALAQDSQSAEDAEATGDILANHSRATTSKLFPTCPVRAAFCSLRVSPGSTP